MPDASERRIRVCLDLNDFVAAEIATALGRSDTTPVRLIEACVGGRFDLVVSRRMLDHLVGVLMRPPLSLTLEIATLRVDLLAELSAWSDLLVAGSGVLPLRDHEDRGVLETALAGRAHYLATYNRADFRGAAVHDRVTGHLRVRDLRIVHPRELAEELRL